MTDQLYYWTDEWQANEALAIEEIRTGKARVFDNADEAIKWLMSAEHQEDPDRPNWCVDCRCAWPCPSSYVREPVPPVSLTRGGFMLGHR
jgi:hypothetical protein